VHENSFLVVKCNDENGEEMCIERRVFLCLLIAAAFVSSFVENRCCEKVSF
jgi:hypothetical protein